jgi:hypothetical protein
MGGGGQGAVGRARLGASPGRDLKLPTAPRDGIEPAEAGAMPGGRLPTRRCVAGGAATRLALDDLEECWALHRRMARWSRLDTGWRHSGASDSTSWLYTCRWHGGAASTLAGGTVEHQTLRAGSTGARRPGEVLALHLPMARRSSLDTGWRHSGALDSTSRLDAGGREGLRVRASSHPRARKRLRATRHARRHARAAGYCCLATAAAA